MMKNILLTVTCMLSFGIMQAQRLEKMIERDTNTYIFSLDKTQLTSIVKSNAIKDTNWYYKNLYQKISADSFKENKLIAGNYLICNFIKHTASYRVIQKHPFECATITVNKDVIFYITNKDNEQICKTAFININNTTVLYDSGYGGYAIRKELLKTLANKNKAYLIDVQYENTDYVLQASYIQEQKQRKDKQYIMPMPAGYLVTNKPVYKPLDTLKLKAYLINSLNGNTIDGKVTLQIYEPTTNYNYFVKLKAISAGAYTYEWVLPDSLQIDKTYNINISYKVKGHLITKSETFYLEDYILAKNNFDMQMTKPTFYEGEDISFMVSATDANRFPLNGVQMSYSIKLNSISNVLKDTLLIPNKYKENFFKKDTILPYDRMNVFKIPSGILPLADAQYDIEVSVTDPITYERKVVILYATKIRQAVNTMLYQSADSACIRVLYNNKDTAIAYQLIALNGADTITNKKIVTPYYYKLSANTTAIITIDAQKKVQQLPITFNALQISRTKYNREIDSIHFTFQYPFVLPIYYKIFKDDIEIKSGETHELKFDDADASNSKYTLLFTQQLNNNIVNNFYSISIEPPLHQLQVKNDLPETAFPGQKLIVHLQINDAKGNALKNINVASFAQNAQFGSRLHTPNILVPSIYEHLANVQNIVPKADLQLYQPNYVNNYSILPKHTQLFNLHKNEWYQLHHAIQQMHTINIPTLNAQSEYCIVMEKNHTLYTPKYVKANEEYVYMNDVSGVQNYSIYTSVDSMQNIKIRFANYLIQLAPIKFASHTKTIIVIRADSLEYLQPLVAGIKNIDTMPAFTSTTAEKESMLQSIILVSGINFGDTICLQQNTKISRFDTTRITATNLMIIGEDAFYIIGPVQKNTNPSISINGSKHNMAKGLQVNYYNDKMQQFTTRNYQKSSTEQLFSFIETNLHISNILYKIVADTSITLPKKMSAEYRYDALPKAENKQVDNYIQQYNTYNNKPNININLQNNNDSIYAKAVWIVSKKAMKESVFLNNVQRTNFVSINAGVLKEGGDIYIMLNNAKLIKYVNLKLQDNDGLYINPVLSKSSKIEPTDLDSALMTYNKITAIPMRAFYMQPLEIKSNVSALKNDVRKNIYIHGNVHDDNYRPIANAIILAEINGKYQFGAITNNKGEYEMLDVPSATYQFKVYATDYTIAHILPQSYAVHHDYLLNVELAKNNTQAPVWEASHNEFRMMAYVRDETENKIMIHAYDIDTREPIENVQVKLAQVENQMIEKILSIDKEIPFLKTEQDATMLIQKNGYQAKEINGIRCVDGYYYVLDVFMKKWDDLDARSIETYSVSMYNFVKLETQSVINNKNIKLTYSKKPTGQNRNRIHGTVTLGGKKIPDATIEVYEGGIFKGADNTDANGKYLIDVLSTGDFEIRIMYAGTQTILIENVHLVGDNNANIDIELMLNNKVIQGVRVEGKKRKMLAINQAYSSSSIDAKKIEKLGSTNSIDAVSLSAGSYQSKSASYTSIGGGRAENTIVIIDGVVSRDGIGAYSVAESLEVNAGGLPASVNLENEGELQGNLPNKEDEKFANLLMDTTYNAIRKNFTDEGFWVPNIVTNKMGSATFAITLPDNITTWRAHTMAMGAGFQYGVLSQNIAVYKPLQTMCVVPSFMYKGDALDAKANFINLTSAPKRIATFISINAKNVMNDTVNLEKQLAKKYTIKAQNTDTIIWRAGLHFENNYKDAEQYSIPVFSSALATYDNQSINMEEDSLYQLLIDANTKGSIIFNNNIYEKIMLYIDELGKYEYGCVEQTTSKLKAILHKQQILVSMGLKPDVEYAVNMLMSKLKDLQNSNNTWGWWRKQNADWNITLYVCDVLQSANNAGFSNSIYLKALQQATKDLQYMNDNDAMYALYILQKNKINSSEWNAKYTSVNAKNLNTTAKMYYYKVRLNNGDKVSDVDMYSIILEMKNNRSMNYERHFFNEPKADWFRAFLLFQNTKWENEMLTRFKNELLSGAEKNLNTFTKALLVEALVQKAGTNKTNAINASVVINDTLTITNFPYTMPIQSAVYRMKHSGASVFVNTVEAITIEAPKKVDTLFNVSTNFSTSKIKAGLPVQFMVDIEAYRTANFVMVEIPIPSGMQIDEAQKKSLLSRGEYIEFYKHKINMYYTSMPKGTYQTIFKMMPNFTGTFTLPATKVSLMYYPYVYGCNENRMVVVE